MPTSLRLLLAFLVAGANSLGTQDTTRDDPAAVIAEDSAAWREGLWAGHESAERQPVAGRGALGLLGAAGLGYFVWLVSHISS